ncbi:uncharacterized protein TOT_040000736 [Theileria orientalis strain Shintoku]|uniref:Membrane skeletal protein IMC1 n=1 Tax=Theileria orientalis strain Shintoku TaxID=869250 RepID=J7MF18_THEOR|nr:uncharacterized protein TOT_040000736 [Theileria orientalis strain Shintoku]PVC51772.1 hypothetical protein MACL_00001315 [Theileria orientalis]BAM42369.1 uncharacterized protein TOT_040000736 [Theileria orientalis strain Shintoku]|eukprot:XP_009692670.1 uncharacterized protein TOT_040000736 [Theileria orientalis strain Shintoku]
MKCCNSDNTARDCQTDFKDVRLVNTVADRSRAHEVSSRVDRQWVAVTTYQPVDTITKTVEIPVIKTVERIVHKPVIQERVIHVPREVTQIVEKVVEVPDVKYVEKIVEVPQVQYRNKLVPKVEVVEKVVEKPQIIEQWVERKVEVPQIKEVVRYKEIQGTEEVIKYYPKGHGNIDWDKEYEKANINGGLSERLYGPGEDTPNACC